DTLLACIWIGRLREPMSPTPLTKVTVCAVIRPPDCSMSAEPSALSCAVLLTTRSDWRSSPALLPAAPDSLREPAVIVPTVVIVLAETTSNVEPTDDALRDRLPLLETNALLVAETASLPPAVTMREDEVPTLPPLMMAMVCATSCPDDCV